MHLLDIIPVSSSIAHFLQILLNSKTKIWFFGHRTVLMIASSVCGNKKSRVLL